MPKEVYYTGSNQTLLRGTTLTKSAMQSSQIIVPGMSDEKLSDLDK